MEEYLNIVEERSSPQQDISIDSKRLKFFTSKLKIWDNARQNFDDFKKLLVEDRSSLLKSYYVDMVSKYGNGSGIFFLYFQLWYFFSLLQLHFFKNTLFFILEIFGFQNVASSSFKRANLVSLIKTETESDRNFSTQVVAARFEKEDGSIEVSGEKLWKSFSFFMQIGLTTI